ncbi:LOW QUALITY PROTEIN: ATP-binding cassette sub-family A member 13-like [Megaptera novaeangliae]
MLNHMGAGRLHSLGFILANLTSCVLLTLFQGLTSATSLEATSQDLMQKNSFLASIIFNRSLVGKNLSSESLQLPPQVTYSIWTSILCSIRTDLVKNPFWKFHLQSLPANGFKYNYLFVPLQDMVERAIISVQTGQEALDPAEQVQAILYPCHTSHLFLNNVAFFPLIAMLTWMVSVASVVRRLVYEREIQLEENSLLEMKSHFPPMHPLLVCSLHQSACSVLQGIHLIKNTYSTSSPQLPLDKEYFWLHSWKGKRQGFSGIICTGLWN